MYNKSLGYTEFSIAPGYVNKAPAMHSFGTDFTTLPISNRFIHNRRQKKTERGYK